MSDRKLPQLLQDLVDAKKLLPRESAWCKHAAHLQDATGAVMARCIVGAFSDVASRDGFEQYPKRYAQMGDAFLKAVPEDKKSRTFPSFSGCSLGSCVTFNNHHETTYAEMVEVLDRAIEAQQAAL